MTTAVQIAFRNIRCGAVVLFVLTLLVALPGGRAMADHQTGRVDVADRASLGPVNHHASFLIEPDTGLTAADVLAGRHDAGFRPVTKREPDFGYIDRAIWLRLDIGNSSAEPVRRYLMMHTNFMSQIEVFQLADGQVRKLLAQDEASGFGSRPVPYSELIAPFSVPAGETGQILIRYASNGDTVLPLSVVDKVGLAAAVNQRLIVDFSFYGLMVMVVLASVIGRIIFHSPTFVAYAVYVSSVLLLIFQRDGYAFQYLWPNAPAWNDFSSLPLGAGLPLFAAVFTRSYLNTRALHPALDKVLIAVGVLQISVVGSAAVVGAGLAKQLALVSVSAAILVFISIGVIAYRHYGRRTLFFLIGWLGLFAGTVTMTVIHWTDIEITRAQSLNIMRAAMVFDALMMGLASIFRVVDLQRDRELLEAERVEALDANLALHQRFARLEKSYHLAQGLARTRGEAVSDLTHDLRQPIFALKAALGDLSEAGSGDRQRRDIENALEYLDGLVESALANALDDEAEPRDAEEAAEPSAEAGAILDAAASMFAEAARDNGVDLRVVRSSVPLAVDTFPVLRILSNFLSNAIRFAPGTRVLIGVRRKAGSFAIEVHDTGPGLDPQMLRAVRERHARGATDDDGHGLGFSIVDKIAGSAGLSWTIESRQGHGTITRLLIPRA